VDVPTAAPARSRGLLHLAALVDPARAPRPEDGEAPVTLRSAHWAEVVTAAEHAGLDLVEIADAFGPPTGAAAARPDALTVAAHVGTLAGTTAVAPTVTTTHTAPSAVATALQTLDWLSGGRTAWSVDVSAGDAEAALTGRRRPAGEEELWAEAAKVIDTARRLWDSWEDGAVVGDAATGWFVDGDRRHRVDVATRWSSVEGPSTLPRPPQGRIPVIVPTHPVSAGPSAGPDPHATAVAAAHADVVRVGGRTPDDVLEHAADVLDRVEGTGRDPAEVRLLGEVDVPAPGDAAAFAGVLTTGAGLLDGWVLRPVRLPDDLLLVARDVAPVLAARGLRAPGGATLRERLGLGRPVSRYARTPTDTAAAGRAGAASGTADAPLEVGR